MRIPKVKRERAIKITIITVVSLVILYIIAVYSNIPFIAKWRTIYIETAMSTMTHQWLATAFIPQSVIDEVVENTKTNMENNLIDSSNVPEPEGSTFSESLAVAGSHGGLNIGDIAEYLFSQTYDEIDMSTLPPDVDYTTLQLSDCVDLGIKTKQGDAVWAIDVPNKLLIIEVRGSGYVGKLAVIKDSSNVYLHVNTRTSRGSTVNEHCAEGNAILGINGSGFIDYDGKGNGATPVGLVLSDGEVLNGTYNSSGYQVLGFDYDDNFRMGSSLDLSTLRDAIQFYPILVLNGEKVVSGSYGLGLQPRSVIGQTRDKETLMLVIDGRQIGYSIGATVNDCADILLRYDCYNAMNLDGGSSSSMTYNGEMITSTSSPMATGRYLPNAWVVTKLSEVEPDND